MGLTESQKKAVTEYGDKNVCVSAGAGSGKTLVLVERFIDKVRNGGLRPDEILAITFTDKAANEMKERAIRSFRDYGMEEKARLIENGYISTIDSFCSRILKEYPIEAGVEADFTILEPDAAGPVMDAIIDDVMEASYGDERVKGFLRDYTAGMSEDQVKKGIRNIYNRLAMCGSNFRESALKREDGEALEEHVGRCSGILRRIFEMDDPGPGKPLHSRIEAARALHNRLNELPGRDEISWEEIEAVKGIAKGLDLRIKNIKDDIVKLQGSLDGLYDKVKESFEEKAFELFKPLAVAFEERFKVWKKERGYLDFNDLERHALRLLTRGDDIGETVRRSYKSRLKYIMVDEFQDTNPIQDMLIEALRGEDNLFIVGDVKQSIYGFRGAEPSLFRKKEKDFEAAGERHVRLPLTVNFRSRRGLIDFANDLFGRIWSEDGFSFERLEADERTDADFSETDNPAVEILYARPANPGEEEPLDELRVKEAALVAGRIRVIVEEERPAIYDKKEKRLRPVRYKDIAILLRTMTASEIYEQKLKESGVPYYTVSGREFYGQREIIDMISLFQAVEQPRLDVPFCGVLKSPMAGISDDGLFWLAEYAKADDGDAPLYSCLGGIDEIGQLNAADKAGLTRFRDVVWRRLVQDKDRLKISELIDEIFELTDYDIKVLKERHGKRKYANLMKLKELAHDFEKNEAKRLGDFIYYVQQIQTLGAEESEAQVELEAGDCVKIMTVHKAKGLEFPVAVLGDLGSEKYSRSAGHFLFDPFDGIGIKVKNGVTRQFEETESYRRIKRGTERREKEEFKRLFYVAVTRARELLIFAGSLKSFETKSASFNEMPSYMQWLNVLFGLNKDIKDGDVIEYEGTPIGAHVISRHAEAAAGTAPYCLAEDGRYRDGFSSGDRVSLPEIGAAAEKELSEKRDAILKNVRLERKPYFETADVAASYLGGFAVSPEDYYYEHVIGLRRGFDRRYGEEEADDDSEELSRREMGNIVHKILEFYGYGSREPREEVKRLAKGVTEGLSESDRKKAEELALSFVTSEEGKAAGAAADMKREFPFLLRLRHGIIRGVIDLLYKDKNGAWAIVDYKNSDVEDEAGLEKEKEKYAVQVYIYAIALKEMTGIMPGKASLYFTELKRSISFGLDEAALDAKRREIDSYLERIANDKFE